MTSHPAQHRAMVDIPAPSFRSIPVLSCCTHEQASDVFIADDDEKTGVFVEKLSS